MVRVNRNLLTPAQEQKLFSQLNSIVASLDKDGVSIFMNELLGSEEKLTIAKRLSALLLLIEGYSQYKTAKLLKLSPTSTKKIATQIQKGEFSETLKLLNGKTQDYFKLLSTLDSVLHLGGILPHYNGIDRYKI